MTDPTPPSTPWQTKLSPPPATPPLATPPPATPPRQPGEIGGARQQARWPKIIGIISIVFGVGGCLGGVWGFLTPMFMEAMATRVPASQAGVFSNVQSFGSWIVINSALTLVIGLALLIVGIALVRRRRYGINLGSV